MRERRNLLNISGEEDKLPKSSIVTNIDVLMFHNVDIKLYPTGKSRVRAVEVVR